MYINNVLSFLGAWQKLEQEHRGLLGDLTRAFEHIHAAQFIEHEWHENRRDTRERKSSRSRMRQSAFVREVGKYLKEMEDGDETAPWKRFSETLVHA
jgi:hypothetical protein